MAAATLRSGSAISDRVSSRYIWVLFPGFVITGAATVLLSPLLPLLSTKWELTDRAAGALFTSQFLGSMVGTLLSGVLIRKIGFGRTLFIGYMLMAVYACAVGYLAWPYLVALLALNGFGLGFVIPATNMAVSECFAANRASALNLINLAWSVGAIACPAVLAGAARVRMMPIGLFTIGILAAGVGIVSVKVNVETKSAIPEQRHASVSSLAFIFLAALFFFYIGTEGAVAGWLATYAKRTVFQGGVIWMTAPSFFWAAIMVGRAIAPAALRRMSETALVQCGLLLSAAGIAAILMVSTPGLLLAGVVMSGLGMSVVFPIFIAMVSQQFGEAAVRISPYMFAMAALGGAVLPWLVGIIASETGRLQAGLVVSLVGVLIQIALVAVLSRQRLPTS